jgi:hypothetical protein
MDHEPVVTAMLLTTSWEEDSHGSNVHRTNSIDLAQSIDSRFKQHF